MVKSLVFLAEGSVSFFHSSVSFNNFLFNLFNSSFNRSFSLCLSLFIFFKNSCLSFWASLATLNCSCGGMPCFCNVFAGVTPKFLTALFATHAEAPIPTIQVIAFQIPNAIIGAAIFFYFFFNI
jgi:hypothetical protein